MAARAMLATTRAFATQRPLLAARAAAATRLGATKQRTLPYVATRSLFGFGGGAGGDDEDPESKKARRDVARAVVDAEALASSDGGGAVGSNGGGGGVLVGGGGGGDDGSSPASVGVGDDAPRPERVVALGLSRRPLFRACSGEDEGGRPAELLAELGDDRPLDALVHATGAFAQIHNVADTPDGNAQALVLVHRRVDAERVVDGGPPPTLAVAHWDARRGATRAAAAPGGDAKRGRRRSRKREASRGDLVKALSNEIVAAIRELVQMNPLYREHMQYFTQRRHRRPFKLADFAASLATAPGDELQTCLEERDEISSQVEKKLSGQQRTFLLNEQLKTIKKELGVETDDKALVASTAPRRASRAPRVGAGGGAGGSGPAASSPRSRATPSRLAKLAALEKNSAEFNVHAVLPRLAHGAALGRGERRGLRRRRRQSALDAGHYGMDDVKERILELVAVGSRRRRPGKILCLVGPPGTGKTSIGESVAAALGREFYRFSVGGLGDVAEIKGHRRTYVGSMPGKPIQCLKQTRAMNPVILIDEVDKLGRGGGSGGGDPASALLELLDPSQNATFLDHYLDVPVDLSRCLFVCTANDESTIPGPLLDRMEVLRLAGYDLRDKLAIARDHLVPRALKEAGLDGDLEIEDRPRFTDAALEALAKGHARGGHSGATLDGADLHVHFPDGATPKDGPSAGVTLATALLSLASGTPARQDLAMTGEISLTGKVLPVGGIKEKVIAARREHPGRDPPAENRRTTGARLRQDGGGPARRATTWRPRVQDGG
ncbi:ATP-dependent serine protease [Aureococcus anophagefferens]|nr:ATP-dependent serine protease [Aureococcus anophagefferens]